MVCVMGYFFGEFGQLFMHNIVSRFIPEVIHIDSLFTLVHVHVFYFSFYIVHLVFNYAKKTKQKKTYQTYLIQTKLVGGV